MLSFRKFNGNKHVFIIFVFFTAIYLLLSSGVNLQQSDVGYSRMEVARSIVERLDLNVPAGTGIVGVDGKDYSLFGIGSVLLSFPLYLLAEIAGVPPSNVMSLMNPLIGAATAALIFLFSTYIGYPKRSSIYVAVIYGLCTTACYYAKDPGDHVVETFFIVLSFYLIYRYLLTGKAGCILISGISLGIACLTRPTSLMVTLPLLLMLGTNYAKTFNCLKASRLLLRDCGLLSLTLFPFACIFLWYNNYRFGSVFETGYSLMATRLGLNFFNGTPIATGLTGLLASPGKGFFYYSPVAILFFFALGPFIKKHRELAVAFISMIVLYFMFFSKNIYWHGDWAWGPRYLFVLTPFFIIPIAEIFETKIWMENDIVRKAVYSIICVSLLVQIVAVSVNTRAYFIYLYHVKKIPFTFARGVGVQPINEPVTESYFNWRLSPILVNAELAYAIASKMGNYKYTVIPESGRSYVNIREVPELNLFDFWWIYNYYVNGSLASLFAVPLFLIYIVIFGTRLKKLMV